MLNIAADKRVVAVLEEVGVCTSRVVWVAVVEVGTRLAPVKGLKVRYQKCVLRYWGRISSLGCWNHHWS